jgi:hypothetical protein
MGRERRLAIRRYQLQLYQPDSGGWHTVVTAVTPEALDTSARLLSWQTEKRVRILDPEGQVLREAEPPAPSTVESGAVRERTVSRAVDH